MCPVKRYSSLSLRQTPFSLKCRPKMLEKMFDSLLLLTRRWSPKMFLISFRIQHLNGSSNNNGTLQPQQQVNKTHVHHPLRSICPCLSATYLVRVSLQLMEVCLRCFCKPRIKYSGSGMKCTQEKIKK